MQTYPCIYPPWQFPGWRTERAISAGVEKRIMLRTWGGIGDQICAEPTLRFALDTFKNCEVFLASEAPEFFAHLPFKKVFDLRGDTQPHWDKYLVLDTILPPEHLQWEFMSHMLINCVDYPSLCALRCQLPVSYKPVRLVPTETDVQFACDRLPHDLYKTTVAVHPGKHWQSKTFPVQWWNAVLTAILAGGLTPVIIGGNADDNRTTVEVDMRGCIDMRGKLSLMQSIAFLQRVQVLLTNDSAPLHMAASGGCHIGYVATCKHPDYISHWRKDPSNTSPVWNWRMHNFSRGGIWDVLDYCPNKENKVEAENVGDDLLRSWLPDPLEFARWAIGIVKGRD